MDEAPEPLTFTGFLIRRAQQAHVAAWQEHVSPAISSVQFGVLAVLARRPGASQRELGDELDLDRSTIAELVSRLETNGLVERRRHAGDRRRNILSLSARGMEVLERLRPDVDAVEHVLTDALSAAERLELRRLLVLVLGARRQGSLPRAEAG
jgi:DNA-binding MarR family transcriptional regulator